MAGLFENWKASRKKWRHLRDLLKNCPDSGWMRTPASEPHFDRRQYEAVCQKGEFAMAISRPFSETLQIGVKVEGEAPASFVVACPLLPFGARSDVFGMASAIVERIRKGEERRAQKRENDILDRAVGVILGEKPDVRRN